MKHVNRGVGGKKYDSESLVERNENGAYRGTKGFCGTCMRTIMLIENRGVENKETVQVDFDDKRASSSKRRKSTRQENFLIKVESLEAERADVTDGMPFPEGINWATKELLEFVAHMRNGDTSVVSRFDVQALLLEYITRSNLRDPSQKSYIVCDSMLIKLFGKTRVGHFEMFKLLDSHFLAKDHSRLVDTITRGGTSLIP
ncbi:hypothetical protein F3Y22_tig00005929pilonHSYRG00215 [Hibiscus syriacus]|uniref:DM2 domain-containing protein n=1 Tax=Hibiscus syriacus TaxID=106335 RepID=A0A6A3CHX7_HIBSY|nr:hypothetical protein F3Y22_tig00005929pilonHSYRG00215 [Hibiscus syriacus]